MPDGSVAREVAVEASAQTNPVRDGGEALLEACRRLGVTHIFSSPGSEWAPVWEALARQRRDDVAGPEYHDLVHETLAVGMATGYALAARQLAVVLLHAAPGLLQGSCAIHGALLAGAPMLVCSSESVTYGEGDGPDPGGQWYRNLSIVGGPQTLAAPFTKWASQAATTEVLYEMTLRAAEMARRAPSGPVYLNVPLEALLSPWTPPPVRKPVAPAGLRVAAPEEIDSLSTELLAARRPVVLTESAGRDPRAFEALVALCETLAIPVIEPGSAVCANFPKDHELHLGADVAQTADADLVMLVACRAPWYPPSASPSPDARIVVIDETPQRPHIAYQVLHADRYLEGDVGATLTALREAVTGRRDDDAVARRRAVVATAHAAARDAADSEEQAARALTDRVTAVSLVTALREELPDDAVVVDETITHSRVLQRHLRWNEPDRWFYVQGGLGQGTAVALGVKQALGARFVTLAIGDGSFLYNPIVGALMASRDLELPLLIVIFNNRQYLSMKLNHLRFYPEGAAVTENDFDGVDLSTQPPLSALGVPFGVPGWQLSDPGELVPALRDAVATVSAGTTAIVDVAVRSSR